MEEFLKDRGAIRMKGRRFQESEELKFQSFKVGDVFRIGPFTRTLREDHDDAAAIVKELSSRCGLRSGFKVKRFFNVTYLDWAYVCDSSGSVGWTRLLGEGGYVPSRLYNVYEDMDEMLDKRFWGARQEGRRWKSTNVGCPTSLFRRRCAKKSRSKTFLCDYYRWPLIRRVTRMSIYLPRKRRVIYFPKCFLLH